MVNAINRELGLAIGKNKNQFTWNVYKNRICIKM